MSQDLQPNQPINPPAVQSGSALGLSDNIKSTDMRLPRVALTQALSETVVDGKHSAGRFINTLTKEELPSPLIITPVFAFKNVIRWKPRSEGGGIVYRTMDITSEVANDLKWNGDIKPLATAYINVVCLVKGSEMPLVVSFCNTGYTTGQNLITLIQLSGCAWKYNYILTAKKKQNNQGTFFVFDVARGAATEESVAREACTLHESVKHMTIETDYEGATEATPVAANTDGL